MGLLDALQASTQTPSSPSTSPTPQAWDGKSPPPAGSQAEAALKHTQEGLPYFQAPQQGPGQSAVGTPAPSPPGSTGAGTATPDDAAATSPDAPLEAGLGGAAEAAFQAKDAAMGLLGGGEAADQRSDFRKEIEARTAALDGQDGVNNLATGIAQFGTAFLGVGKFLTPLVAATRVVRGTAALDALTVGGAGAIGFDAHEHALDGLLQQYPELSKPVTQFLGSKQDEGEAEGRLRNAVENILIGAAGNVVVKGLAGVLTSTVKAVKFARLGNVKGANAATQEAQDALLKATPKEAVNVTNTSEATPGSGAGVPDSPGTPGGEQQAPPATGGITRASVPSSTPPQSPAGAAEGVGSNAEAGVSGTLGGGQPSLPGELGGAPGTPSGTTLERIPPGAPTPHGPVKAPVVETTPEDFEKLLHKAQADTGAILDAGSYNAALEAGHLFAPTDTIPWQKLATGAERVDAWLARMVETHAAYVLKARGGNAEGVLTDAAVNKAVATLVKISGKDPAMVRGMLAQAGKDSKLLAIKMETAYVLAQKAETDSYGMAMRINAGNYGEAGSREVAVAQAKQQVKIAVQMFAAADSMTANAARALRRMQAQFSSSALRDQALMGADLDKMGSQDFLDMMSSTQGTPGILGSKLVPTGFARAVNFATMVEASSLIWGWGTTVVIATGQLGSLYLRPLMKGIGAHYEMGRAAMQGNDPLFAAAQVVRSQARKEFISTTAFIDDGWHAAVFAFIKGEGRLAPHTRGELQANSQAVAGNAGNAYRMGSGDLSQAAADWRPVTSPADLVHNAVLSAMYLGSNPSELLGMTFRLHGAIQEFMRTLRYRAVVVAKADSDALAQGLHPPQGGFDYSKEAQAYTDFVKGRVQDSFGPKGEALDLEALQEAQVSVFNNKLLGANTGQTLGNFRTGGALAQQLGNMHPAVREIMPYIQIPANLFRANVRMTAGLNMLQTEYRNNLLGKNGLTAQAMATGEMSVALLFGLKALEMRFTGQMTGAGSENAREASAQRDEKIMPHAIKYTDGEGHTNYFAINRFDPLQGPLTFWADVADIMMQGHAGDPRAPGKDDMVQSALSAATLATMHLVKDKAMLKNLSDFMDAMQDESKMQTWFKHAAPGMLLPASSALRMFNPDPFMREVGSVMDGIKADIPGLSSRLPLRLDYKGDPVTVPGKFVNTATENGVLGNAHAENYAASGYVPTPPVPRTSDGVDLRTITTERGENAYMRFKQLAGHPDLAGKPQGTQPNHAKSMEGALEKMVSTSGYEKLVHGRSSEEGTKEHAIESVLTGFHQAGMGLLRKESPAVNQAMIARSQEIKGQLQTRQKDLRASKAEGATKALNALIAPYGMSLPVPNNPIPPTPPGQP